MALRTVPWLTLKRVAKSFSLGMDSLGFHSPDCRLCSISTLICWYSGLNRGPGAVLVAASVFVVVDAELPFEEGSDVFMIPGVCLKSDTHTLFNHILYKT